MDNAVRKRKLLGQLLSRLGRIGLIARRALSIATILNSIILLKSTTENSLSKARK